MTLAVDRVRRLDNPIQYYAWGSHTAIAELCGRTTPSPDPEAELWLGAHPKAPSRVIGNDTSMALDAWIARDPAAVLGGEVARRFKKQLPFLFKVLAAKEPLSIQAHPDEDQAREGFARENRAGIPLAAPHRNYRDAHHKPEIICALTEFWALNGFRPMADLQRQLRRFCPRTLATVIADLPSGSEQEILRGLFDRMLSMPVHERDSAIDEALGRAGASSPDDTVARWLRKLQSAYPGDIGILTPILLNLVCLKPGQAMFLPAGRLHAYLLGAGIELMANSDNVLRGGLTPKHVDREELMRVLRFEAGAPGIVAPQQVSPTEIRFPTPAEEFSLSKIAITPAMPHAASGQHPVEILLVAAGQVAVENDDAPPMVLTRGESIVVPAAAGSYRLVGEAEIFRATVPEASAND